MTEPPIVEFRAVSKRYRDLWALRDVSFRLAAGEVLGYLGPNGAGKTTSLKILAGLLRRFEGTAAILGQELPGRQQEVHRNIGFLPQSVGFQEWRTADTALRTFGRLSGVPLHELDGRIAHWLERFDLGHVRYKRIKLLSGGMIQKLGLIQAILHEPKFVILDEPLSGLDPASRMLVKEVVRELRAKGTAVMFSSHILSDVEDVADRIGIIRKGELLRFGQIDELRDGMPIKVALEFSHGPGSTDYLTGPPFVAAKQVSPQRWELELPEAADLDTTIHQLVQQSLQHNARLREIGPMAANLDVLYTQVVGTDTEQLDAPAAAEVAP